MTNKVSPEKPGRWLHDVVVKNATLAGVSRRNTWIVKAAFELRITSDYDEGWVDGPKFSEVLRLAPAVLSELGVSI